MKNLWVDYDCTDIINTDAAQVFCLYIGHKRKTVAGFLILAADDRLNDPVYRRVGLVEVFGDPDDPAPGAWMLRLLANGQEQVVKVV
jgi:hypothetical protein